MRRCRICSVSWEEAKPHDRGHRTFVIDIIVFYYCLYCLTLLFSVIVYMVTNITIIFPFLLEIFGVMALSYFVTVFCDLPLWLDVSR